MKVVRGLWLGGAIIVIATAGVLALRPRGHAAVAGSDTVTFWVADGLADYGPELKTVIERHHLKSKPGSKSDAEIVVSDKSAGKAVASAQAGEPVKLRSGTMVEPKTAAYVSTSGLAEGWSDEIVQALDKVEADRTWTMDAVGDISIGREVYFKIKQYGANHPFEKYADKLRSVDLAVANLECSISDANAVVTEGGMALVAPTAAAGGLKWAGLDAVNMANNHSYNGGSGGFLDTLSALDGLGVGHFGGGANAAAARAPWTRTVKGVRVAMLGYSSIAGSQAAGDNTPGMGYLDMAPWGQLNDDQVKAMQADIRAAKAKADVVLVYYHWGKEYTHDANADQREVAHRAIDAGADVILGTHPHWVQGVEWYHDRLITYSLGNFVFDQEWSNETKQGTLLHVKFDGSRVAEASLEPYTISDFNQPAPAAADVGRATLGDVFGHSWWPP
jgi:poly-gamma-glutamate capsule biosynthesis protein CapA/YwtB (metallophosphatase superfamily)